jgi:hypothetical protein
MLELYTQELSNNSRWSSRAKVHAITCSALSSPVHLHRTACLFNSIHLDTCGEHRPGFLRECGVETIM